MTDSPSAEAPAQAEATTDVKDPAASSAAEAQVAENKTTLEAVQAALKGPEKSTDSDNQDSKAGSEPSAEPEKAQLTDEISDEEMKRYGPKTQARITQLLAGRAEARNRVKELEPKAAEFDRMTDLMTRNRLSPKEVNDGFEIMADIKLRPDVALQKLAPIIRNLLDAVGINLPDDLKQEVQSGNLSEERARELSVARKRAERASAMSDQERRDRDAEDQRRQAQAKVELASRVADRWHAEKVKSDPDWSLKQDRIVERLELKLRRNPELYPANEKDARKLLEDCQAEVENEIKRFRPAPQNVQPAGGQASPQSRPQPKTALEAAQLALKGM